MKTSAAAGADERERVQQALRDGRVSFLGLELHVATGALVPRAETELLALTAIAALTSERVSEPRVIDMCCGAGNLACVIADRVRGARVWAADLTASCVALARRNAESLGFGDRVSVREGDLFAPLVGLSLENTVDAIVCNPPYISDKRLAEDRRELVELEPAEAFAAGPYGLGIHQRVVRGALAFLRPGGILLVEIGAGQQRQVEMLFRRARGYDTVTTVADRAGEPRVLYARRAAIENTREKQVG